MQVAWGPIVDFIHAMEHDKDEESGEMYSPDEQGEYMPKEGAAHF